MRRPRQDPGTHWKVKALQREKGLISAEVVRLTLEVARLTEQLEETQKNLRAYVDMSLEQSETIRSMQKDIDAETCCGDCTGECLACGGSH